MEVAQSSEQTGERQAVSSKTKSNNDRNSDCAGDMSTFCKLGVKFGYCSVSNYRTACCETCKDIS